jgi:hypothetical protein
MLFARPTSLPPPLCPQFWLTMWSLFTLLLSRASHKVIYIFTLFLAVENSVKLGRNGSRIGDLICVGMKEETHTQTTAITSTNTPFVSISMEKGREKKPTNTHTHCIASLLGRLWGSQVLGCRLMVAHAHL